MLWFGKKKDGKRYVYTVSSPVTIFHTLILVVVMTMALLMSCRQ